MKGLVLSGGHGIRLRPLTHSQQKQLIPVANKPILFHCIEDLINAGIKDIGIIVGPNKEQVMEAVKKANFDANIQFIFQDHPHGLAHAVKISRDFLGNEKFIMYLGDNILKGGCKKFVEKFKKCDCSAELLLTKVNNPERYGVALVDEQKKLTVKLVEKPKTPISNLSLVGIYGLNPNIFDAIENIKPSWRNELEITDALQWLIENNHIVHYEIVDGWWKDTGRPEDILDANRLVLEDLQHQVKGTSENSTIKGKASIDENTIIKNNSIVKGPVIIGKNCLISNAYIGPYTSIGDNCKIENTELEGSIVMENTQILNADKIVDSLIGKDVNINKNSNPQKGKSFIIGDNSTMLV